MKQAPPSMKFGLNSSALSKGTRFS